MEELLIYLKISMFRFSWKILYHH